MNWVEVDGRARFTAKIIEIGGLAKSFPTDIQIRLIASPTDEANKYDLYAQHTAVWYSPEDDLTINFLKIDTSNLPPKPGPPRPRIRRLNLGRSVDLSEKGMDITIEKGQYIMSMTVRS